MLKTIKKCTKLTALKLNQTDLNNSILHGDYGPRKSFKYFDIKVKGKLREDHNLNPPVKT
jgi:hypothetical protein